jgi:hypothetical protein
MFPAFNSKPQIVILRNFKFLLGPEIPLGCLDRAVPEQELNLLKVSATLPAELRASPPQVVGSEALDTDLFCRLLHDRPDRPVAQTFAHPAGLARGDAAQERSLVDAGRGPPGVDSLLDPDRYRDGADASSLPLVVFKSCFRPTSVSQIPPDNLTVGFAFRVCHCPSTDVHHRPDRTVTHQLLLHLRGSAGLVEPCRPQSYQENPAPPLPSPRIRPA